MVHREDTRIDYGPVTVGDKTLIVPVASDTLTALVPAGENDSSGYKEQHRFVAAEYSNYRLAAHGTATADQ